MASSNNTKVDVLIVGSGPIGSTFARVISENALAATMLMVDVGPQLTDRIGMHVKNIADPVERAAAQVRSQGPTQYPYEIPSIAERADANSKRGPERVALLARPGTHLTLTDDDDLDKTGMPAAAHSTNVGGMGSHWTCACPRPGNTERVQFISEAEWDSLCTGAEQLLCVTQSAFPESAEGYAIKQTLGAVFNAGLPEHRKVQAMPLAVQITADGQRYWTAPDVVLGPLVDSANTENSHFELRSETICRQLFTDGDRVTGALIEHLPSGKQETIEAQYVVVVADSFRTPQLLWASGIRPRALGHYINDHLLTMAAVELDHELVERARTTMQALSNFTDAQRVVDETTIGVFWVPYHDPVHPFHAQVMHFDLSLIPLEASELRGDPRHMVAMGWGCRKELRYEDCIEFLEDEKDYFGMPKMIINYGLSDADMLGIEAARKEQAKAALAFGKTLKGDESHMVPPGSSLHYQGSIRIGEQNDSTSVCDPYSRVWGFENLFVGGNGTIPTATVCNPTLTSVALAVRASSKLAAMLSEEVN